MILIFSKYDIKLIKKKIKLNKSYIIDRNSILDNISNNILNLYNDETKTKSLIEDVINCNINMHIKMSFMKCIKSKRYDYIFYIDNTLTNNKITNIINYIEELKNSNINNFYNINVDCENELFFIKLI